MPTVNIYYKELEKRALLQNFLQKLKEYISDQLNCSEIKLKPNETSIRLLRVDGEMIGEVELEISAFSFDERVKKQDEICLNIMEFLRNECPDLGEVKVWLQLSELGHSWKN